MESLSNLVKPNFEQIIPELIKAEETSNCVHRQVGAVLWYEDTKNPRIIATGANISPYESPCIKTNSCTKHFSGYCPILHAEINCIYNYHENLEINKKKIDKSKLVMIATYSPCYECNKNLVRNGIKHIYYIYKHHRTNWDYLRETMINYEQLSDYENFYKNLKENFESDFESKST